MIVYFVFYDVKFDPNKSTLEKVDYLNPMGIYSNLVCYIERGDLITLSSLLLKN